MSSRTWELTVLLRRVRPKIFMKKRHLKGRSRLGSEIREARSFAAMIAILLLCCCTHFAMALNGEYQLIKEVLELPVVDQCDLGYVYEQVHEDDLFDQLADLRLKR